MIKGFDKIKVFADTFDIDQIKRMQDDLTIDGFTTNPTLFEKEGNKKLSYLENIRDILNINEKHISFALLSEDPCTMLMQAADIAELAPKESFYIKVPVIDTRGVFNYQILTDLYKLGFNINVTCIFTQVQLCMVNACFCYYESEYDYETRHIFSIFAGRLANIFINPRHFLEKCDFKIFRNAETLWASTREIFNIQHAINGDYDIITIDPTILEKLDIIHNPKAYSQVTVEQFQDAANKIKFK